MIERRNNTPIVLRFSKKGYERKELESLTDKEKYELACRDKDNCQIMSAYDYTKDLNDFKPMERYVYTYIICV